MIQAKNNRFKLWLFMIRNLANLQFCLVTFSSVICLQHVSLANSSQYLGDRLLFAIGQETFSQRDLENYIAIRSLIIQDQKTPKLANQTNWLDSLEFFRKEMIISLEAKRLSRFYPKVETIRQKIKVINNAKTNIAQYHNLFLRLSTSKETIVKTTSDVLQVADFTISKNKFEKEWFEKLENSYIFRLFEGSESYRTIQPTLSRSNSAF